MSTVEDCLDHVAKYEREYKKWETRAKWKAALDEERARSEALAIAGNRLLAEKAQAVGALQAAKEEHRL